MSQMTPCIRWEGKYYSNGYGRVGYKMAHRVVYEEQVGVIPEGLHIDHLCRNRWCVNPEHLEPVTLVENVRRGESFTAINSRKTHCKNGHELTEDNIYQRPNRVDRGCRTCRREAVSRYQAKKRG